MLDLVGAFFLGIVCAADAAVLIGLARTSRGSKFMAFVIAGTWTGLIVAIGAGGGFAQGVAGPVPAPVIAFMILLIAGLAAWFGSSRFRVAFHSVPLAGLVGVNTFRILGLMFLLLHDSGRLANPFAACAGWGDILTGLAAIPLAVLAASGGKLPRGLLIGWNIFGALDLLNAVAMGAVSAPGTPFHLLREPPGTLAMGTLPWVTVPAILVPVYLITHLEIGVRLRKAGVEEATTGRPETHPRAA
jgi:hypothetical protein